MSLRPTPQATLDFLSVLFLLCLLWDWACLRWGADGSTISEVIYDLCNRYKIVLIMITLLFWHLVLGQRE